MRVHVFDTTKSEGAKCAGIVDIKSLSVACFDFTCDAAQKSDGVW